MIARIMVILEQKLVNILIADSGSTKTIWASIIDGEVKKVYMSGLNPALSTDDEIETSIQKSLIPGIGSNKYDKVYFYGAGCGRADRADRIQTILRATFPRTDIHVKTDIEGAGLALFGQEDGIVIISGTGSSAGMMRNGELIDQMPSFAYPKGDFGSGSHIGGMILEAYLSGKALAEIAELIESKSRFSKDELYQKLLNPDTAKEVAAQTMMVTGEHSQSSFIQEIAERSIRMFMDELEEHFSEDLKIFPIKMNGRTAHHFSNVFTTVFEEEGILIETVRKDPIEELIRYYSND